MARPHVPPHPPAPDELDDLSVDDGSPPLLSEPADVAFTTVHASGKQRVTPLQHASPKQPKHSPMLTGNSFGALDIDDGSDEKAVSFGALDVDNGSDERAADSDDSLYKAVVTTSPDVGQILRRQDQKLDATVRRQDQKLDATVTTLMDILFKKMDDRFARLDDRFADLASSMKTGEQRHFESLSHLEDRLLAKFDTFNGQIGNLCMDSIDHERRINDQNRRIDELKSNLLKLESVHKG